MSIRQLFKHTAIYGLATVMPRLLNLVLTPLHTSARTLSQAQYGLYQGLFAYMILGNVLLTYGYSLWIPWWRFPLLGIGIQDNHYTMLLSKSAM